MQMRFVHLRQHYFQQDRLSILFLKKSQLFRVCILFCITPQFHCLRFNSDPTSLHEMWKFNISNCKFYKKWNVRPRTWKWFLTNSRKRCEITLFAFNIHLLMNFYTPILYFIWRPTELMDKTDHDDDLFKTNFHYTSWN